MSQCNLLGEEVTYHTAGCEVRALLVLLPVAKKTIKRPDPIWHKVMRFQEVEILKLEVNMERQLESRTACSHHDKRRVQRPRPSLSSL